MVTAESIGRVSSSQAGLFWFDRLLRRVAIARLGWLSLTSPYSASDKIRVRDKRFLIVVVAVDVRYCTNGYDSQMVCFWLLHSELLQKEKHEDEYLCFGYWRQWFYWHLGSP